MFVNPERFGVLYNPNWLNGEELAKLKICPETEDAVDSIRNQEQAASGAPTADPNVANEFPEKSPCKTCAQYFCIVLKFSDVINTSLVI